MYRRSLWPIFHGPVILPYTLKTIWCMNIIIWDSESVWSDVWPQNKRKSLWPIFHGPVILPYILKTIWCMNIIISSPEQRSGKAIVLPPASASANVKVLRQSFYDLIISKPLMYLVHVWYDDRYWSKILQGTIPIPVHDFEVKVTDLECFC